MLRELIFEENAAAGKRSTKCESGCGKEREDMTLTFNVTGSRDPKFHYMVDITDRLVRLRC